MDQNQTADNDLQKAIDDITNNTNIDPVFSDPVAAPSSVPEGDTGELDEPVGPFSAPEEAKPTQSQGPGDFIEEPVVPPLDDFDKSNYAAKDQMGQMQPLGQMPMPEPAPLTPPLAPFQPAPAPVADVPDFSEPLTPSVDTTVNKSSASGLSVRQVKAAALRDLVPLIDRLNMSPSQRFNVCRDIFEDLRDYSVIEQAYHAASEIPNETERAEALLYLVESIDKM